MAMTSTMSETASVSCLGRYLTEIRRFPTLAPEQELRLARSWSERRDERAAETLVTSHLGLIVKIAHGFRGYGLPLAELVAEGNVGMMQAIARFDPERGFRLSTYAMWWIRAAILEYILRSWSMVRLCTTPRHKRLFFKLRKLKGQLRAIEEGDLTPEIVAKIAQQLDVPESDVVIMNRRLAGPDHSLNAPVAEDGDAQWQDWLVDPAESQETNLGNRQELDVRRDLLHRAMVHLSERERHILTERRLRERPLKLEELAIHYGVSRERIRQIEERAFRKLQEAMGAVPARDKARPPAVPPTPAPVVPWPVKRPETEWIPPPAAYPGSYAPQARPDWMKQPAMAR